VIKSHGVKKLSKRLEKVKTFISKRGLDGVLISSAVNRRYFSNFTGTSGNVIITAKENLFITDFRYVEQAKQQCGDFVVVMHSKDYLDKLFQILKERGIRNLGIEDAELTYSQYLKMDEKLAEVNLIPLGEDLNRMRMVKDSNELEYIKEAARIADAGFEHILDFIKPGIRERDISLELEYYMRKQGISAPSFEFIVASGWRSALPHGVASDKQIEEGELVTLDFGGIYRGYCSDMTRTVAVGKYTSRQKEIYDVVLSAQLKALEQLKPGMTGVEVDKIARDVIENAGYGENFGHGLGHGVGLFIHEAPTLSYKGEIILEPGMTVTVEPGVYVPDFGGVRIEDLVVVTEMGIENFTHSPKELIVV